MKEETGSTAS